MKCCDAWHVPHDGRPGQCSRAIAAMCRRMEERARDERKERQR